MEKIPDDVMDVASAVVPGHDPNPDRTLSLVASGILRDRANREATSPRALGALRLSYVVMLGMPYEEYRAKNQHALAAVRDAIADMTGGEPEAIQAEYEAMAAYFAPPIQEQEG